MASLKKLLEAMLLASVFGLFGCGSSSNDPVTISTSDPDQLSSALLVKIGEIPALVESGSPPQSPATPQADTPRIDASSDSVVAKPGDIVRLAINIDSIAPISSLFLKVVGANTYFTFDLPSGSAKSFAKMARALELEVELPDNLQGESFVFEVSIQDQQNRVSEVETIAISLDNSGAVTDFVDYFPTELSGFGFRDFVRSFGSEGVESFQQLAVGTEQIPYTDRSVNGLVVANLFEDLTSGVVVNDGRSVRFLNIGGLDIANDSQRSAAAPSWSFAEVFDGQFVNLKAYFSGRFAQPAQAEFVDSQSILIKIDNISVLQGDYAEAVVFWTIDRDAAYAPLNLAGEASRLGLSIPTASETQGGAVTSFDIFGKGLGPIAIGDVDAASGQLVVLHELQAVSFQNASSDQSLIGSWSLDEGGLVPVVLTFLDDQYYVIAQGGPSTDRQFDATAEYGRYSYDAESKQFSVDSIIKESDGDTGLGLQNEAPEERQPQAFARRGDQLFLSVAGEGAFGGFELIANDNDPLIGGWLLGSAGESGIGILVFYGDGDYVISQTDPDPEEVLTSPTSEYGFYTYDASTEAFEVNGVNYETDGSTGLYNASEPADQQGESLTINGDTLRFRDSRDGDFDFTRVR